MYPLLWYVIGGLVTTGWKQTLLNVRNNAQAQDIQLLVVMMYVLVYNSLVHVPRPQHYVGCRTVSIGVWLHLSLQFPSR